MLSAESAATFDAYDDTTDCALGCFIRGGEALVLDGETYCLRHAGLQALNIVSDAAEGGDVTVKLLADARQVLAIIDAKARARVVGKPRSHRVVVQCGTCDGQGVVTTYTGNGGHLTAEIPCPNLQCEDGVVEVEEG